MSYRIILQERGGRLLYSNGYDDEEGALRGAQVWAKHEDLEVLQIEDSDGSLVPAETLSAALSAREPLSRSAGASA